MKTIVLDFDGVLNDYKGWTGPSNLGNPQLGAREFVERLCVDYEVIIHSTRDPELLRQWLRLHNFPPLHCTDKKPPAIAYLDDRAIRFNGNYSEALDNILAFKAYWEV